MTVLGDIVEKYCAEWRHHYVDPEKTIKAAVLTTARACYEGTQQEKMDNLEVPDKSRIYEGWNSAIIAKEEKWRSFCPEISKKEEERVCHHIIPADKLPPETDKGVCINCKQVVPFRQTPKKVEPFPVMHADNYRRTVIDQIGDKLNELIERVNQMGEPE